MGTQKESSLSIRPSQLWFSLRYACQGLVQAWKSEQNVRIEVLCLLVATAMGVTMKIEGWQWAWISLSAFGVLVCELLNTALERLVNIVSPGWHPLAEQAKDIAAAAVMCTVLQAMIAAVAVFGQPTWLVLDGLIS